jgi:SAM-dependent methyltransferase
MSLDKAREILKQAMADRSVYDAMAASENEVWGTILPALEDSQARLDDIAATEKLNANRHQSYLIGVAHEKNLRFTNGLTLGCGAGRLERALVHEGICSTFHGIDISDKAIAAARRIAKKAEPPPNLPSSRPQLGRATRENIRSRGGPDLASSHPFSRTSSGTGMAFTEK